MKNLSIDLNLESFKVDNFTIITFPEFKNTILDLVNNFHKKSNKYIGRRNLYLYENIVIRKYYHGGLLRKVLNDNFLNTKRFLNEFNILHFLNSKNFPTTKVIGLLILKKHFYNCFILTYNIKNSLDLVQFILKNSNQNLEKIFYNSGQLTKKLHSFNIIHNDLHLKNFLIKNNAVYLIDFDKSFFSTNKNKKINDIKRFIRSFFKFNYFSENKVPDSCIKSFLSGYEEDINILNEFKVNYINKISWLLNKPPYLQIR